MSARFRSGAQAGSLNFIAATARLKICCAESPAMPLLAVVKRRIGQKLQSSAAVKEASQTQLCAYLSVALLVGLLANALAGWWWADPTAALVIAGGAAARVPRGLRAQRSVAGRRPTRTRRGTARRAHW